MASDYHLSLETVYTQAAREMIREKGNLQTLSACVHPSERMVNLPTWVPYSSLPAINRIPSQLSADAGLACTPPRDGGSAKLDVQGTRRGAVSRASGRRGTGPSEKLLFDKSWLSMLLSLRGKGGYGPHPNLPEVLWRTLCMDMPYGSQSDPEAYGSHIPAEFAGQFRVFMLLVILYEVDGLILQHLNMPVSTNSMTFCSTPHDPMSAELGLVLEDIEAITSHDGGSCCLPSRQKILYYWHDFKSSLVRNVNGTADGPNDFYLPTGVGEGKGW